MPRIVADIPQTYENIVRPVALDVARQLVEMLALPKSIKVLLPGVSENALYPNTELGKVNNPNDPSTFGHGDRFLLEIQENPVEDRILTTAVHQRENIPFFHDKALGIRMYPVYAGTEMNFNIQYRASSRTLARRFRNEVLARTAAMREGVLHELTYHYHVPPEYLHLLKHIHTLRENQAGYGESFDTWVTNHIDRRATNITDQVGQSQALVIQEFQTTSMGHFQFLGATEAEEKEKDSGTFIVTFQYRMIFDEVIKAVAEWPLMIHGQLIDEQWRGPVWSSGHLTDPNRRFRHSSLSRHALDHFTTIYTDPCKEKLMDGYVIPVFDEWRPQFVMPNTSTLFVAMLGQDDPADDALFDLMGDLDGYSLHPDLRAFMAAEAPYMNRYGASIFDLRLYEEDNPMDDGTLSVSPHDDMTIICNAKRDMRKNYHIRMALVNDLHLINTAAWERLRSGGAAAVKILNCLQFKLLGKAFEPKLLGGYLIRNEDLRLIAQRINDLKVPHKGPIEHVMLTVNEVVVATHRSSEYGTDQERVDGTQGSSADTRPDPFTKEPDCGS